MQKTPQELKNVRYWLGLGVTALALAGIYAIILVVARSPAISNVEIFRDLFSKALIVHVDLSVLVWFLCAFAAMATMFTTPTLSEKMDHLGKRLGWWPILFGTVLIVLSPFDTHSVAYKNNYVPMLSSIYFEAGIALVFIGGMLFAMRTLFFTKRPIATNASVNDALGWGARGAAIIVLFTCVALLKSLKTIPEVMEGEQYFEMLFWAGGHIIQFAYTQILMIAWVVMAVAIYPSAPLRGRPLLWMFLLNTLIGSAGIFGSLAYEVSSFEHHHFFTQHMIVGGGLMPTAMLFYLISKWAKRGACDEARKFLMPAFAVSILLFIYGGVLGLMIQGQDVTIPAHYHGAIIAITMGAIGFTFTMLPNLYPHAKLQPRLMHWQPKVLGFGQFLHISGLAWSGGYGALRKTPGTDSLPPEAVAALGMMGIGGLLAIIGGLMFVVIVWRVVRAAKPAN
jgi:hypothetical protein